MFTAAVIIIGILTVLIGIQAFLASGFIRRLNMPGPEALADAECPKAAIIVCIRGKDPTLSDCLTAALNQDYPNYGVHIVVDSASDPAWPLVNKIVAAHRQTPATVQTLTNSLTTCSLKCSSLVQAISSLNDSYEIVALLDADVVPHRRWLKDLTAPLADPAVGAATGNRWFAPDPASFASLTRYGWNAGAVTLMYWLNIAWGGSLAIKRKVIEEGGLLSLWSRTYCEDTAINPALQRLGLRLEFTPRALVMAGTDCDFSQLTDWITRQLLACRLHHRGWRSVVLHAATTSASMAAAVLLLFAGLISVNTSVFVLMGLFVAGYVLALFTLLIELERRIRGHLRRPEEGQMPLLTPILAAKLLFAVIVAQILYTIGLLKAASARAVEWRGARYEIFEGDRIHLIERGSPAFEPSGSFAGSPQVTPRP